MKLDLSLLLTGPTDIAHGWIATADDDHGVAARATASAHVIALAVLVLRRVNPHATVRHLLSYVRHSTLRDIVEEAAILEPEMTARIMRAMLRDLPDDVVRATVRANIGRWRRVSEKM